MEFIKEKKNSYNILLSNELIELEFDNWHCHYGIEKYKSKNIINLNLNKDNSGYNLKQTIKDIYNNALNSEELKYLELNKKFFYNPIKKNKYNIETVRIEIISDFENLTNNKIEKNSEISGKMVINNLWIWDNSFGLKIVLKN